MKKKKFWLILGIVLLCVLLIAALALWQGREVQSRDSSHLEFNGAGYHTLEAIDSVCYLVDDSGVVCALDWETGEKEYCFTGPEGTQWRADSQMKYIYYKDGDDLCRMTAATEETEVLGTVEELPDIPQALLGCGTLVTEHFLVYWATRQSDLTVGVSATDGYWALDLDTMTKRQMVPPEGQPVICCSAVQGDTVYLCLLNQAENTYTVERWDLAEQTTAVLDQWTADSRSPRSVVNCVIYGQRLYYVIEEYEKDDILCSVPLEGGEEAERQPLDGIIELYSAPTGLYLRIADYETTETVLCRYDTETGECRRMAGFPSDDVYSFATNGRRYAALTVDASSGNVKKLILGDLEGETS